MLRETAFSGAHNEVQDVRQTPVSDVFDRSSATPVQVMKLPDSGNRSPIKMAHGIGRKREIDGHAMVEAGPSLLHPSCPLVMHFIFEAAHRARAPSVPVPASVDTSFAGVGGYAPHIL